MRGLWVGHPAEGVLLLSVANMAWVVTEFNAKLLTLSRTLKA